MSDDEKSGPDKDLIKSLLDESRDLIKRLEGSTVQRLSVQAGEYRIEIERGATVVAAPGAVVAAPVAGGAAETAAAPDDNRHAILSPLVGTFYGASQPGAKPFVEEGDVVEQGQALCIVEAMKIMNQVTADRPGRVAEICCKDGDWVEYQQVVIYLEPIGAP
jgi:acetyl-CoA carboxylase biotin carboxyl carrier protein